MTDLVSLGFKVDTAQVRGATRDLKELSSAGGQADSAAGTLTRSMGALKTAIAALGVGAAVVGLQRMVRSAIDAADEMSKLAQKTGLAVNQVAGLQLAFQQSGLSAGALQQSIGRLAQAMGSGNSALAQLGISARDASGNLRGTREVMGEVADRFAQFENGAQKTALAMELFGRSGADLIPLLNGGAAALNQFDATAARLGLTLDERTARAAEQFNDTLDTIRMGAVGLVRQLAVEMLPALNAVAGAVQSASGRLHDLRAAISSPEYQTQVMILQALAGGALAVAAAYGVAAVASAGFALAVKAKTAAVAVFNAVMAVNPLVLLAGVVIAAAGAIFVLRNRVLELGESTVRVGDLVRATFNVLGSGIRSVMGTARSVFGYLSESVSQAADDVLTAMRWSFSWIVQHGKDAVNFLIGGFIGFGRAAGVMAGAIVEAFRGAFGAVLNVARGFWDSLEQVFSGDFSFGAFREALKENITDPMRAAARAIGEEVRNAMSVDYVGAVGAAISETTGRIVTMAAEMTAARGRTKDLSGSGNELKETLEDLADTSDEAAKTQERLAYALQKSQEAFDAMYDAQQRQIDINERGIRSAREFIEQQRFEIQLLRMSSVDRQVAIRMRQLEMEGVKLATDQYELLAEAMRSAVFDREAAEASVRAHEQMLEDARRVHDDIGRSLTDAIMRGGRNAADSLRQMFRRLVLEPSIRAGVDGLMSGFSGGGGAGSSGGGGIFGSLQRAWSLASGGFASSLATSIGTLGTTFGSSALTAFATGMKSAIGSTAAGFVGPTMAGAGGAAGIGASLGSAMSFLGPIAAGISLLTSFWGGRKTTGAGLQLGVSGGALQAAQFEDSRRTGISGLFGKSRRTTLTALDPEAQAAIDNLFSATMDGIKGAAKVLGADASAAVANATVAAVKIDTRNMSQAQIQQAIADWIESIADTIVGQLFEGVGGARAIELASALAGVNEGIQLLGHRAFDASIAGAQMAESLAQMAGGLENLQALQASFYENFYSEAEREANLRAQLTDAMAALNMQLPETRDQFRALVEAQDLTTESGRQAYATLLGISGAFASITQSAEELAAAAARAAEEAQRSLMQEVDRAFAALQRAVQRERQALQAREQAIRETVRTITSMVQQLRSAMDTLRGGSSAAPDFARAARQFIGQAAIGARRGALPDAELLSRNLPMALESVNAELFATSFEQERARRLLLLDLAAIADTGEAQLTTAERQLKATQDQIARLDAQLAAAQAQIDAIRGVDNSVISVQGAIDRLSAAIQAQAAAQSAASAARAAHSSGGLTSPIVNGAHTGVGDSGYRLQTTGSGATLFFPGGGSHTVQGPNAAALLTSTYGLVPNAQGTLTRRFANGGSHMGGLRMVGERGPEIEATGPSRIVSHERLMQALTGSAQLGGEVAQMRSDMMAGLRAIEKNTREIKQIEQRWDRIGLPEQRELV